MMGDVIKGRNLKIQWGSRSITKSDWLEIKAFLKVYNIHLILEYGVGLSTELLLLEGYQVHNLECTDFYAHMFSRKTGHGVIPYEEKVGPPDLAKEFPFALVDSPKSGRKLEVQHAICHASRFIYMHNPRKENIEDLEQAGWEPIEELSQYHGFFRFYRSKQEARANASNGI
jgi:hypothetical protein